MGPDRDFLNMWLQALFFSRVDDCQHCLSVEGLWGCPAQQERKWWEGRLLSLSTPDLTLPIRAVECLNGPFPV